MLSLFPVSLLQFYRGAKRRCCQHLLGRSSLFALPVLVKCPCTTRPLILATLFCSLIILAKVSVSFIHRERSPWQFIPVSSPFGKAFCSLHPFDDIFIFLFFLRQTLSSNNKCKDFFYCIAILIYQSKVLRLLSPSESSLINNAQHFSVGRH